jgi:AmpE protein
VCEQCGFSASTSALQLQQLLDWLPARVFAFIFALGGNFTKVFNIWKKQAGDGPQSNNTLLGDCGIAALDVVKSEQIPEDGTAENEALTLLDRVLVMSLVVLAMIVIVT